jgi:L-asparaginase
VTDLHVVTTGGTIDKIYFDRLSDFEVGAPQVGALLEQANVTFSWDITALLRKDSLELTDVDRDAIVEAVAACGADRVLVTHGTDTMLETAERLLAVPDKTIVLTGAMQPATQRDSDAVFNIGFAIGVLRTAAPGVYVAINGQIFLPGLARKNRARNRFEQTGGDA